MLLNVFEVASIFAVAVAVEDVFVADVVIVAVTGLNVVAVTSTGVTFEEVVEVVVKTPNFAAEVILIFRLFASSPRLTFSLGCICGHKII